MAKRKSKRVSRKTMLSAAKKVRENFRKQRKLSRRQEMSAVKVPRSLLLTDAEKEQIRRIKEETRARTAEHLAEERADVAPHIAELLECIQTCDTFVEIVDCRDVVSSRSRKCEELLRKNNKRLFIYLSHPSGHLGVSHETLETGGIEVMRDHSALSGAERICVFGNPKSGKFVLAKEIERQSPGAVVRRITTPPKRATLSGVMRSAVDEGCVDSISHFRDIYQFIDKPAITDFYMIEPFESCEDLLTALGKKFSDEQRPRRRMEAGALKFIRDAKSGKIQWARTDDQFTFKFTAQ